jgi:hypothetical protein
MKTKQIFLIAAGLLLCLYACKKPGCDPAMMGPVTIIRNWNIVSDSTFVGVGSNNHPVAYIGQPGDYFDFTTNGTIYTKEGAVLDTLSYKLLSDTSIVIGAFGITLNGVAETSRITNLTVHSLVIKAPIVATYGGTFGRKISLNR